MSRRRKDVFRLEREREKFGTELSEARGMYMQALEDVKASHTYTLYDTFSILLQLDATHTTSRSATCMHCLQWGKPHEF